MFATKRDIALAQLDAALAWGVRRHVVLADAGYGDSTEFREALAARGLQYVVAIPGTPYVWPPESSPSIPPKPTRTGRPRSKHTDPDHPAISVKELSTMLTRRSVSWREGSRGWQSSRFAAVRVHTAHGYSKGAAPGEKQWLLCEWRDDGVAATKFYLSNLPPRTSLQTLVRLAKLRWRVERDYQEMKQEIGLDHFEGRTWRGFHHHATLCAVAHAFLALRRALFPPEQSGLDAAAGEEGPAAGAAQLDRSLPALP